MIDEYEAAPLLLQRLEDIDELCQQGLNSPEPVYWEAGLQDIMELARETIALVKGAQS